MEENLTMDIAPVIIFFLATALVVVKVVVTARYRVWDVKQGLFTIYNNFPEIPVGK